MASGPYAVDATRGHQTRPRCRVWGQSRRSAQVKISDLEGALQHFINQSFENITSIENSLNLLTTFQAILQRETLKSDLDSKLNVIFQNYGADSA